MSPTQTASANDNHCLYCGLGSLLANNRYGFHRDELQVLSDARHLDWGFVAYSPWLAGHDHNSHGVENEEREDHPNIFVCGAPRSPWPDFWTKFENFA